MDAVHDSLTVLDIEYWNANNIGQEIRDSRLASFMNVRHFYMPSTKGKENIPVASFPYTHVCTNDRCKRLFYIREELKNTNYLELSLFCVSCKIYFYLRGWSYGRFSLEMVVP